MRRGERTLVVVPTYEERENLPAVVTRLRRSVPTADVLVVDDASPDGTGDVADALAAADPAVHVLHRAGKQGLGTAYVEGFCWGRHRGYDVLVEMDADGSHQPEQLPRLLHALTRADLAIGSRWVPGGEVHNWPWQREVLSRGANLYARLVLGIPVRDATAGFRAYRGAVLDGIDLGSVSSQGYCFQIDLVLRALYAGFRVVEVPIDFVERTVGASKMSTGVFGEALTRVAWWGVTRPHAGRARPCRRP